MFVTNNRPGEFTVHGQQKEIDKFVRNIKDAGIEVRNGVQTSTDPKHVLPLPKLDFAQPNQDKTPMTVNDQQMLRPVPTIDWSKK